MIVTAVDAGTAVAPAGPSPLLGVHRLTKTFPGVLAVDSVNFSVTRGEIVALLGHNGAGKSTLIQVISGVHPAGSYSGEISFDGSDYSPGSVAEAEASGVAFLAQEINVVPDLSVAENLALNNEPVRHGFIDRPARLSKAAAALRDFGLHIDPAVEMGSLDLATQQLILIVRALSKNARLLILDEPTAALNDRETRRLFDRMRALRAKGVSIIFVSHRLAEVFEISDRIVVMRDGRIGGEFRTAHTTRDAIVTEMVGLAVARPPIDHGSPIGAAALQVHQLSVADHDSGRPLVIDLDLSLRRGAILGLFGLLGSGVVEAAMAIFGAWRGPVSGTISVDGKPVAIKSPADAVRLGIGLISQDRRDGLSGEHSIYENSILASLNQFSGRFGLVDRVAARRKILDLFERLRIRAGDIDVLVATLSGGNQQKVQVARWLSAGVEILLLIDPTRGVDVGVRAEITHIWRQLANTGCAILLVSSDTEELIEVCDSVVVMRHGRTAGEVSKADLDEARLLRLAAGI